jgi:predicted nucleic acid-binding protein
LENSDNPFEVRRIAIDDFFKYAVLNVEESDELINIADGIKRAGLKTKDSLHIASAIVAQCDYFLTTDDRLLKYHDDRIRILNPIDVVLSGEEFK